MVGACKHIQAMFSVLVCVGIILMCLSFVSTSRQIDDKLEGFQKLGHTLRKRSYGIDNGDSSATSYPTSIPILASCDALKKAGFGFSGTYRIDPDGASNGLEPFSVVCDMTSDLSLGYTTVHHDKEEDGDVNGFEDKGSFRVSVTYDLRREQIEAIKAVSSSCRQFIKYECIGSLFKDRHQHWISFYGRTMVNWGGVPTGIRGCACGVTGTCDDPTKLCNCDVNDDAPRLDQGYLTDKATLPVSQLRFGDTGGAKEKGVYTLGPLQCA
ncbi:neurexin-4-like [Anneissia japonica]|uniref:neurexin-4-like n=1 Tax=Anneissia japonica TaxID=1529436 RepID=UPI0014259BA7|nr:neurexin-4-like [Anneissia japonica]